MKLERQAYHAAGRLVSRTVATLVGVFVATAIWAGVSPLHNRFGDSYYFVDHYDIVIDRPADAVWPHMTDLASWLTPVAGKGMIHVAGPRHGEGEVFRLYRGQDFFLQITKIIPNKLIMGVNLPASQRGEKAVAGVVMMTLMSKGSKTVVSVFMSRQYSWFAKTPDPLRKVRESAQFAKSRRASFEEALERLKALCID